MDTNEVILLQTLDYFRKKVETLEGESYRADELDFCYNSLHEDYVKKCAEYNALEVSYNKLAEVSEAEISKLKKEVEKWQDKYNVCSERVIELQERVEDKTFKDEINGNYIKNLEAEVAKLKKENIDLEKENDEYSKDFSELNSKYQALKKEKESATWEWSVLKTEKNDAESRYIDMKNNMEDLVKDYDKLYEENNELKRNHQLLKDALDMRMTECDKLKGEIRSLKNQINFEKEYEATWGKVDMANIVDSVCEDINEVTTPISSEEADILAYMAGWEKAGY